MEIAWAAGFFDGEGHTKYRRLSSHTSMQVGQRERETLERFQAAVGGLGRISYTPKKDALTYARGRGYWTWQVASYADVIQVASMLYPFLSEPKRTQIDKALTARAERIDRRREGAIRREEKKRALRLANG